MQLFASKNSQSGHCPGGHLLGHLPNTRLVPEPSSRPRNLPFSIGPPERPMVGSSQEAAPMSSDGVVLSHSINRTTPSIGLPRIDSSTSTLARLRKSMACRTQLRLTQRHDRPAIEEITWPTLVFHPAAMGE